MKNTIRLFIISLVLALFVPLILSAQWVKMNGPNGDGGVWKLAVSGTNLVAGDGGNHVYISKDNGMNWTPTAQFKVYCFAVSGTSLFAGTYGNGVLRSSDNGVSWTNVSSGLINTINTYVPALAVSGTNLFAGTPGGVFLSSNNGASWTAVNAGLTSTDVSALAVGGSSLFASTLSGVYRSTDNGTSWTLANNGLKQLQTILSFAVIGTNLFGRSVYGMSLSATNGTSWTTINNGLTSIAVLSLAVSGTNLFASARGNGIDMSYGGVYLSTNNGTNWSMVNTGLTTTDVDCLIANDSYLFAGIGNGVVWRRPLSEMTGTITPQSGWTMQHNYITSNLNAVKAVSNTVAWAAGDAGVVLRTTDGGSSWKSVGGGTLSTNSFYEIEALDASNALVYYNAVWPSMGSSIYRTTDGGVTWKSVGFGGVSIIFEMKMCDASNGYALGDPVGGKWIILKTTNGGASWINITTAPTQVGSQLGGSLATVGTSNIWFGAWDGTSGSIYRSTDGGISWSSKTVGSSQPMSLAFSNAQNGFATFLDNSVLRTTDGGSTWTPVTIPGTGGTSVYTCGNDVFASKGPNIYRSNDRGATWNVSFTPSIGSYYQCSFISTGSTITGWAVSGSNIAQFTGTATASGVHDNNTNIPSGFSLSQNFPNPFNPSTNIQYGISARSSVRLVIYNILGEVVKELINAKQQAGIHSVVWNANVSSGIYFYRLEAISVDDPNKRFLDVKKMLLLK